MSGTVAPSAWLWAAAGGVWVGAWGGLAAGGDLLRRDLPLAAGVALTAGWALWRCRFTRRRLAGLLALGLVCAALSWVSAALRVAPQRTGPVVQWAQQQAQVRLQAVVVGDPQRVRPAPGKQAAKGWSDPAPYWSLPVRLEQISARGQSYRVRSTVLVVVKESLLRQGNSTPLLPGQPVLLRGGLSPSRSAHGPPVLHATQLRVQGQPGLVNRLAGHLRHGLREAASVLPAPERGLLPGLVVGDESGISDAQAADFQTAGMTHLTAVSGANCVLVIGAVLALLRLVGAPRRADPWLALVVLVGFVVLARPQPSVLRAAVMAGLSLLCLAGARARPVATALAFAIVGLLVVQPQLARSYGFALSVAATAGIIAWAHRWHQQWSARFPRLPAPLVQATAVTVAAGLACAPILVLLTPRLSLVSIPANVIAAACVGPATLVGFAALVVAPLSLTVAQGLAWCAWLPCTVMVHTASMAARVPGATLPWVGGVAGMLGLALLIVVMLWLASSASSTHRRWAAGIVAAAVVGVVIAALLPRLLPRPAAISDWVVVACDVGQGDGLLLRSGPHSAVIVDTGPDPAIMRRCLDRLGITQVPLVVLTHLHADHVGGLAGVLEGRHVQHIWTNPLPYPASGQIQLTQLAARRGVPVEVVSRGQQAHIAAVRLHVVWPSATAPQARQAATEGADGSATNNASLVMAATVQPADGGHAVSVALMADTEPLAQQQLGPALLAAFPTGGADVLKVAHHGSAHQDFALLRALKPRIALVSCGADNDYGHPSAVTVQALAAQAATLARTDQQHTLVVTSTNSTLHLTGYG